MKILIIADLDHYQKLSKITNNRLKFLEFLSRKFSDQITLVGQNNNIFHKGIEIQTLLDKLEISFDIIIHTIIGPGAGALGDQILVSGLNQLDKKIIKCLWIEDFHYVQLFVKLIKQHDFQVVLIQLRNINLTKYYLKFIPKLTIVCFDHFIDDHIFKNYQLPKLYDVLLYGYLDTCYPFRTRLSKLLQRWGNEGKLSVKLIKHQGYHNLDQIDAITGCNLSKEINQSWLTVCTRSSFDLFLKKYTESAMSHSMIIGNIPTDYQSLLNNRIVQIDENMTDDEIYLVIKNELGDKTRLIENTRVLYNLFRSKFSYESGGEYFIYLIKQILLKLG